MGGHDGGLPSEGGEGGHDGGMSSEGGEGGHDGCMLVLNGGNQLGAKVVAWDDVGLDDDGDWELEGVCSRWLRKVLQPEGDCAPWRR